MKKRYSFLGGLVWGMILLVTLVVSVPFVVLSVVIDPSLTR